MKVMQIFMTNGDVFHCENDPTIIRKFKKKYQGEVAEIKRVEMTKEKFQDIPVTSESYSAFRFSASDA